MKMFKDFLDDESGVTAIEYAVIGVAMAAVLFAAFGDKNSGIRAALTTAFDDIALKVSGNMPGPN